MDETSDPSRTPIAGEDGSSPAPKVYIDTAADPAILREKLAKYQRVTAKMKETIASTTAQLHAAEAKLATLEPFAERYASSLLARIPSDAGIHPVARVVIDNGPSGPDGTGATLTNWVCIADASGAVQEWHTLDVLRASSSSLSPLHALAQASSLEPHASPAQMHSLRQRTLDTGEELRKFRVRVEALLRSKDAEMARLRDSAVAHARMRAGAAVAGAEDGEADDEAGGRGGMPPAVDSVTPADHEAALSRVQALEAQLERHVRTRMSAVQREAALREDVARLSHDLEEARAEVVALRGAELPQGTTAVVPAAELEAVKEQMDALRTEYVTFRRRAQNLMQDKDDKVKQLTAELQQFKAKARTVPAAPEAVDTGAQSPTAAAVNAATPSTARATSAASVVTPAGHGDAAAGMDAARVAYLKQVITRYLSTHDLSVRAALEPALMTVAGLTPLEIAGVVRSRSAASAAPVSLTGAPAGADAGVVASLWSTASSLLGMASGGPAPAETPSLAPPLSSPAATPASSREVRALAFTPSHAVVP